MGGRRRRRRRLNCGSVAKAGDKLWLRYHIYCWSRVDSRRVVTLLLAIRGSEFSNLWRLWCAFIATVNRRNYPQDASDTRTLLWGRWTDFPWCVGCRVPNRLTAKREVERTVIISVREHSKALRKGSVIATPSFITGECNNIVGVFNATQNQLLTV